MENKIEIIECDKALTAVFEEITGSDPDGMSQEFISALSSYFSDDAFDRVTALGEMTFWAEVLNKAAYSLQSAPVRKV